MGYAPVNNTIVFVGKKEHVIKFINMGLRNSELPTMKGSDCNKYVVFLMRNGRHYEKDRSFSKTDVYFANGLTMGSFCDMNNPDDCEYNQNVRFGCDFDAEISSMCCTPVNGYYSLEFNIETNSCPPEKWVKNMKDAIGFPYAFIHSADYDENIFNYFKEIDDKEDHEYKGKQFEIESNADNEDMKNVMMYSLNEKISELFIKHIIEKTKN